MSMLWTGLYALVFCIVCGVAMRILGRRGPFWGSLGVLFLGWLFFYVAFPGVQIGPVTIPGMAMLATGSATALPVPAFAFWFYMVLIVVGILVVVSATDEDWNDFLAPILALLRAESARLRWLRTALIYGAFPLLCGWLSFNSLVPSTAAPIEARQAHPSIAYDEKLDNPLRKLSAAELATATHEGRHLYAKNCASCHGGKADGVGVMSRALRLVPANFTDAGTIATLVEAYAFKRIQDGGIGLPAAGAPWDSAMPRWKGELTDEEIFKIMLAEYDLGGVSPRIPDELE